MGIPGNVAVCTSAGGAERYGRLLGSMMSNLYRVRGLNLTDKLVDFVISADTAEDAKAKAEDAGLQFVVAKPADESRQDLDEPPTIL
jgi:hypothetical protein